MHILLIYINISINSHSHLTSTIWSEYVGEQIRTSAPGRLRLICIPRVGTSGADPTKNERDCLLELDQYASEGFFGVGWSKNEI